MCDRDSAFEELELDQKKLKELYELYKSTDDPDLLSYDAFVKIIDRNPMGSGFDDSFTVFRYLNRKKKYYGVKAETEDAECLMSDDDLSRKRVNNLDYIDDIGKKVTGVDLTRHHQYKFVSYYQRK